MWHEPRVTRAAHGIWMLRCREHPTRLNELNREITEHFPSFAEAIERAQEHGASDVPLEPRVV